MAALGLSPTGAGAAATSACNPAYLSAKAQQHAQKADDYDAAAHREAARPHPSAKKIAHYKERILAHQKKADGYRLKTKQCEANRPVQCTTKCPVVQIGKGANCPRHVHGSGTGKTHSLACKAAKKHASGKVPQGCRTKHCDPCACSR